MCSSCQLAANEGHHHANVGLIAVESRYVFKLLATGGQDMILRMKDTRYAKLVAALDETPAAVFGMAVSPDGNTSPASLITATRCPG